jgi:hypothetical protein
VRRYANVGRIIAIKDGFNSADTVLSNSNFNEEKLTQLHYMPVANSRFFAIEANANTAQQQLHA